jgi:hypothetical protein
MFASLLLCNAGDQTDEHLHASQESAGRPEVRRPGSQLAELGYLIWGGCFMFLCLNFLTCKLRSLNYMTS